MVLMANLIWLAAGALMRWSRRSDGTGTGSCHHRHGLGTGIRQRDRQCTRQAAGRRAKSSRSGADQRESDGQRGVSSAVSDSSSTSTYVRTVLRRALRKSPVRQLRHQGQHHEDHDCRPCNEHHSVTRGGRSPLMAQFQNSCRRLVKHERRTSIKEPAWVLRSLPASAGIRHVTRIGRETSHRCSHIRVCRLRRL